ncbi:MAG: MgtC/SapB family protein [Sphingomonadales bacterium]
MSDLVGIDPFVTHVALGEMAVRMGLAVVMGAVIGFEREYRNRPAGLRTHMLVALAASTFMIVALEVFHMAQGLSDRVSIDLLRVIEAVTAGVAFLAAGTIITSGNRVAGLTTGASLWLAGAVGLACGIGYYVVAGLATALALIILVILRVIEKVMPTDQTRPGESDKHARSRDGAGDNGAEARSARGGTAADKQGEAT